MIASLPMYWTRHTAPAWMRLWDYVHRETGLGPSTLMVPSDLWRHWRDADLVLSQTCGLPFRLGLHTTATLVGTFDFDLPQSRPGHYHSVIIKGAGQSRFAVNSTDSQSGWAALWRWSNGDLPKGSVITGSHAASVLAVAEGRAGLAAIDAVTWELLQDHPPFDLTGIEVIARTSSTPGLPLITNRPDTAGQLFEALESGINKMSSQDRAMLRLRGITQIAETEYLSQEIPPSPDLIL